MVEPRALPLMRISNMVRRVLCKGLPKRHGSGRAVAVRADPKLAASQDPREYLGFNARVPAALIGVKHGEHGPADVNVTWWLAGYLSVNWPVHTIATYCTVRAGFKRVGRVNVGPDDK